ncbi:MAG: MBL fold metallo-hydrolase [Acidimicrobiales bacterium]
MPFDDADFERASRGLIAQHPTGVIAGPFGPVWDINRYDFIKRDEPNPETVNPSLWRQAQLNNIHGLFEVAPKVWQVRGYDLSNITFIEGDTGWVIIDPLTSPECAAACLELANETLGERPVVAVIYTHSHTDHFGGVAGVITQEQVDAGECRIIAPEHFMTEAVAENVIAGFAMARRAGYLIRAAVAVQPKGPHRLRTGRAVPLSAPA